MPDSQLWLCCLPRSSANRSSPLCGYQSLVQLFSRPNHPRWKQNSTRYGQENYLLVAYELTRTAGLGRSTKMHPKSLGKRFWHTTRFCAKHENILANVWFWQRIASVFKSVQIFNNAQRGIVKNTTTSNSKRRTLYFNNTTCDALKITTLIGLSL